MPDIELFTALELPRRTEKFYMSLPQTMWVRQHCKLICNRCMNVSRCNVNQWGLIVCEPCKKQMREDTGLFIADPGVVVVKEDGTRLTTIPDVESIEAIT